MNPRAPRTVKNGSTEIFISKTLTIGKNFKTFFNYLANDGL